MTTGSYDPDQEETNITKRPAWQKPKTDLQKKLMNACGRKYFKTREERKDWNSIEEKTLGGGEDDFLYLKWVESRISLWATRNEHGIVRTLSGLIKHINNNDWKIDWIAKNKVRLLKDRKSIGITELEKKIISITDEDEHNE